MAGGVLSASGYILSIIAPNLAMVVFTYGIMAAIGLSFNFSGWVIALGTYFQKKHAIATALAMTGFGCGLFFIGPLMELNVDYYGWEGSLLINAGLALQFCVFGSLVYSVRMIVYEYSDSEYYVSKWLETNGEKMECEGLIINKPKPPVLDKKIREVKVGLPSVSSHGSIRDLQFCPSASFLSHSINSLCDYDFSRRRSASFTSLPTFNRSEECLNSKDEDSRDRCHSFAESILRRPEKFKERIEQLRAKREAEQTDKESARATNEKFMEKYPVSDDKIGRRKLDQPKVVLKTIQQLQKLHALPIRSWHSDIMEEKEESEQDTNPGTPQLRTPHLSITFPSLEAVKGDNVERISDKSYTKVHPSFKTDLKSNEEMLSKENSHKMFCTSQGSEESTPHDSPNKESLSNDSEVAVSVDDYSPMEPESDEDDKCKHQHSSFLSEHYCDSEKSKTSKPPIIATGVENCETHVVLSETVDDNEMRYPIHLQPLSAFDHRLFRDLKFWCFNLSGMLWIMSTLTLYVLYKDFAVNRGFGQRFIYVLSGIGLGDLLGRLMAGTVGSWSFVNSVFYYSVSQIICAVCILYHNYISTMESLIALCVTMGACHGQLNVLLAVAPAQVYGPNNLALVFGYILFFCGLGALLGPPIAGAIYDATHSYHYAFYFAALVTLLGGIISFACYIIDRQEIKANKKKGILKRRRKSSILIT